ncbi:MAG: MAPEG family protein [Pseudomonadales bacterium]|nr:MAPEG family protein [Pseudomonadales bacterium]MCP5184632.1 MAPEG family protein [Pseudomonadales bacterium]
METSPLILPVLVLVGWTFVMWAWMYATRIPAMRRANIDVNEISRTGAKLELPPEVSRVADNYNHLHEQPTLFYAVALSAAIIGVDDGVAPLLAWLYVALRIVHSLVQATKNVIMLRFSVFALGSLVLFVLLVRTLLWYSGLSVTG